MQLRTIAGTAAILAALVVLVPQIDLYLAGLFYSDATSFSWRGATQAEWAHDGIRVLGRVAGFALLIGAVWLWPKTWRWPTQWRRTWSWPRPWEWPLTWQGKLLGADHKTWAFLLLSLLIGPGLVANTVLKDHFGRARPVQIVQFGGERSFTRALEPSNQCKGNCSFVCGDAALAFTFHAFAYVVPRRRQRPVLKAGLLAGCAVGLLRMGMGAHFFSDVVFAGILMVVCTAAVHATVYGWRATAETWRRWLDEDAATRKPLFQTCRALFARPPAVKP